MIVDPQLRFVLQFVAVWATLGAIVLLIAFAGGRRQLETAGFFMPYHGILNLAEIVVDQTIIVVCCGPLLIALSDFRIAIGQTLVRFGRWLERLAADVGEYIDEA
ncbi:MAG: hypothetical protein V1905_00045 [bacterium]